MKSTLNLLNQTHNKNNYLRLGDIEQGDEDNCSVLHIKNKADKRYIKLRLFRNIFM